MRANTWHGKNDVRVEEKVDPIIIDPRDAIVKVTLTAICGSDLHIYDGFIPSMEEAVRSRHVALDGGPLPRTCRARNGEVIEWNALST